MLKEFVDRIAKLGQAENAIVAYKDTDLRKVFVRQGDKHEAHDIPPDHRNGTLIGLDDLVNATLDGEMVTNAEVFHDHKGAVLVLDREDRHARMTMPLEMTAKFQKLVAMEKDPPTLAARSLIRMMRFELAGTGVDGVIAALRKLDFTRKSDGRTTTEHGRESLGKSVEAAVQQAEDIPETFMVTVPVYNNPGVRDLSTVDLQMGIHIDVHDETIQVRPLADELQKAVLTAQAAFGEALRTRLTNVPVFQGRP